MVLVFLLKSCAGCDEKRVEISGTTPFRCSFVRSVSATLQIYLLIFLL